MSLFGIFIFLLVLGVLVFVHELGHFLAAKACNVYVDRFSLGMPPRVAGFRYGETDYCIGLLPIGGYVKMAGQEDAPLSDEEREGTYGHVPEDRWFNKKPIYQRAIILAAGPLMNLVLAFGIYAYLAAVGSEVPMMEVEARVGFIEEGSAASTAPMYRITDDDEEPDFSAPPDTEGWLTGDVILAVNGKKMNRFRDVVIEAVLGGGKTAVVEIERMESDGTVSRYMSPVTPKLLEGEELARFGFSPFSSALISHVLPGTSAQEHGLRAGDIIARADGRIVDAVTFSKSVKRLPGNSEIALTLQRDGEEVHTTLVTRGVGSFEEIRFDPPLNPLLMISDSPGQKIVSKNTTFLRATGLQRGDVIVSVDGVSEIGSRLRNVLRDAEDDTVTVTIERATGWFGFGGTEFRTLSISVPQLVTGLTGIDDNTPITIAYLTPELAERTGLKRQDILLEADGQPATAARLHEFESTRIGSTLPVKVKRPAKAWGLVRREETLNAELSVVPIQLIGVVFGTETVFLKTPPGEVIPTAYNECVEIVDQIGTTLSGLVRGEISPKLLGGPVMIGQVTTAAARVGLFTLLNMMAMISINLGIFNLLPLPVLDGGQLAFLAIEAIRRKPVNIKIMEAVQQAGVLLIIGLIVYVTFNDVNRWFNNWLP